MSYRSDNTTDWPPKSTSWDNAALVIFAAIEGESKCHLVVNILMGLKWPNFFSFPSWASSSVDLCCWWCNVSGAGWLLQHSRWLTGRKRLIANNPTSPTRSISSILLFFPENFFSHDSTSGELFPFFPFFSFFPLFSLFSLFFLFFFLFFFLSFLMIRF